MWGHLINIKRPEFGMFSHVYSDLLQEKEKFYVFLKMKVEQFYHLSELGGEEI
jgi:hypothetical protein